MINSWENKTILQQPNWVDKKQLKIILKQIHNYPKLVSKNEIDNLNNHLSDYLPMAVVLNLPFY